MNNLEHSCREASEIFKGMANKARDHKNRERLYNLSLDTLCSAVLIENLRKFEFMVAQIYPEVHADVWRAVNDTEVKK